MILNSACDDSLETLMWRKDKLLIGEGEMRTIKGQ